MVIDAFPILPLVLAAGLALGAGTIFLALQKNRTRGAHLSEREIATKDELDRYRFIIANLKEVVFCTDVAGLWTFLNPAWTEITGFTLEESLGQNFLDFVHPEDRERNNELFKPLIAREKSCCRHEIRYLHKTDGFRWIEVWARLTIDDNGDTVGTTGSLIDVTERKQLQDTLLLYTSAEYRLSEREQEIIRLVKEGCSNKEISAKLFIEAATVKNHLYRIFRKTKARSRTELLKILGS